MQSETYSSLTIDLFQDKIHSYYERNGIRTPIYWDDMVYHFFNESFTLLLVLIVSIALWTNRAFKAAMSSIICWFFIEWVEISLQFARAIDIRTNTSSISWIQLSICLTVFLSIRFFGSKN